MDSPMFELYSPILISSGQSFFLLLVQQVVWNQLLSLNWRARRPLALVSNAFASTGPTILRNYWRLLSVIFDPIHAKPDATSRCFVRSSTPYDSVTKSSNCFKTFFISRSTESDPFSQPVSGATSSYTFLQSISKPSNSKHEHNAASVVAQSKP